MSLMAMATRLSMVISQQPRIATVTGQVLTRVSLQASGHVHSAETWERREDAQLELTSSQSPDRQQGSTVVWMVASSLLDRPPFVESWRQPLRLLELTHLRDLPTRPSNTV